MVGAAKYHLAVSTRLRLAVVAVVLIASAAGGWYLGNTSESVDGRLTESGNEAFPALRTNTDLIGRTLPETELTPLVGPKVSTSTLLGTPLVINFWFSTCEPCRREMPVLAAADTKNKGVVRFVGININDSASVALKFAEKYGVNYELFIEPSGTLISKLGIATAPFTLFIDRDGVIVGQVAGELTSETLQEHIDEVVAS